MRKNKTPPPQKSGLALVDIEPMTKNQARIMSSYSSGKNLVIHGLAGTGKTFLACALGMRSVFDRDQEKLIIYRSAVPTRDMGFLPGSLLEKQAPYETPYRYVFAELFGRGDAYDILTKSTVVEFSTSSFLRGLTIKNSVIVVDEAQNWTYGELDSLITRAGDNTRLVFCGDFRQSDFKKDSEKEGIQKFMGVLSLMDKMFDHIEMEADDIVRSDLVREYILAKEKKGIT